MIGDIREVLAVRAIAELFLAIITIVVKVRVVASAYISKTNITLMVSV